MNQPDAMTEKHYPYSVSLDLNEIPCLVVGGGTIALRKIQSLLFSGAKVTVVSPQVIPEIETFEGIDIIKREFRPEDLQGKFLVISATNNRPVNEAVAREARQRNMLVNVVDVPELCNFFVNSQVRRGDLAISISTGGASPALAKRIRRELEKQYGGEYSHFLRLMREYRALIIRTVTDPEKRKDMFEQIDAEQFEKMLRDQGEDAVRKAIEMIMKKGAGTPKKREHQV